jgi:predicted phage terminase large subunit-like protein
MLQATVFENPWIPDSIKDGITPRQAEFLAYEGREALYGGAAGGGKSVALLIAALQFLDEPGYSALILRRTFKQLSKADSILSKAKEWLLPLRRRGVRYNGDEKKFTFPTGTTLEFGHMDHEDSKHDYQGGSWAFVGVDEATQFTGPMLSYPRTRQRRPTGSRLPIRWRGGSNPGGVGHEYIKNRYIKDSSGRSPANRDRQFFPATIDDNPNIDRADYIKQLTESGVGPLLLAQLLRGDWDAVAGGRFRREWFRRFERYGTHGYKLFSPDCPEGRYEEKLRCVVQYCDPAASEKKTADWTVVSTFGLTYRNDVLWLGMHRFQKQIPDIPPMVLAEHRRWRPLFTGIEAVAGNAAVLQFCQRLPMIAKAVSPMGEDKLVRATSAMVLCETGRLYLPDQADWLEDAEGELLRFTGDDKVDAHDDIVDTLSMFAADLPGLEYNGKPQRPYVHQS